MKNVMYYYNGVEGEEELHEDSVASKLVQGVLLERAGKYWTILEVRTPGDLDESNATGMSLKVFLQGPV